MNLSEFAALHPDINLQQCCNVIEHEKRGYQEANDAADRPLAERRAAKVKTGTDYSEQIQALVPKFKSAKAADAEAGGELEDARRTDAAGTLDPDEAIANANRVTIATARKVITEREFRAADSKLRSAIAKLVKLRNDPELINARRFAETLFSQVKRGDIEIARLTCDRRVAQANAETVLWESWIDRRMRELADDDHDLLTDLEDVIAYRAGRLRHRQANADREARKHRAEADGLRLVGPT